MIYWFHSIINLRLTGRLWNYIILGLFAPVFGSCGIAGLHAGIAINYLSRAERLELAVGTEFSKMGETTGEGVLVTRNVNTGNVNDHKYFLPEDLLCQMKEGLHPMK